ncbi:MAG: hypothetical protein RR350_01745 [Oscillibacter sp.]
MKKILSFFTGMVSMALILTMMPASLASPTSPGTSLQGKISVNQVGVALFSEVKFTPGQMHTATNGQKIPVTLTYTDALGGKTHYLAARTAAELFDVYRGVSWNGEQNCIDFSSQPKSNIVIVEPGKEPPKNLPDGSITITVGTGEKEPKKPDSTPIKPALGRKAGPFTEIDPSGVKLDRRPIILRDGRLSKSSTGLNQIISVEPNNGTVIVITVSNYGKSAVFVNLMRPYTVGYGSEQLSGVTLEPGKTILRAIRMDKDAEDLEKTLQLSVDTPEMGWMTDVSFAVEQYKE